MAANFVVGRKYCALTLAPVAVTLAPDGRSSPRQICLQIALAGHSYRTILPRKAARLQTLHGASVPHLGQVDSGSGGLDCQGWYKRMTVASSGQAGPRRVSLRPRPVAEALPALLSGRLLDRLRERIRLLHYSRRTDEAYVHWCRVFVRFHGLRHPADMAGPESFRRPATLRIRAAAWSGGTTCSIRPFSAHSSAPCMLPVSQNPPHRTPCVVRRMRVVRHAAHPARIEWRITRTFQPRG